MKIWVFLQTDCLVSLWTFRFQPLAQQEASQADAIQEARRVRVVSERKP